MINAIVLNTNIAATTDRPTTTPVLEISLLKKKNPEQQLTPTRQLGRERKRRRSVIQNANLNSVKQIFPILHILNDWCHVLLDWVFILYNVDLGLKNRTIFWTDENIVRFILFLFNDGVVFMYLYKRYRYLDIYLVSCSSVTFPL